MIKTMADYVVENKHEYLFYSGSDHGGQKHNGDDSHANHGFLTDDNMAFGYFLSDDLVENGFTGELDTMDMASTMATMV